ncbi:MAG: hypothetical protein LBR88_03340 [Zoogloeaceae bacterium]|jgi:ABC-type nitrate/sulfonate/bicarbonate transport system substrate-binding protein|nr:hypothetical protein [Zoogloeaceae bacterium]
MSALETLWYTRCPVSADSGIAVQKGWLEEGLRGQCTAIRSLRETSELSVRHGGSIPALWARSAGRKTSLIGLSWEDETQRILALPDSGIEVTRDLKGRRFGVPKCATAQIDFQRAQALRALENALKLDGLTLSDMEIVDFPISGGSCDDVPAQSVAGGHVFGIPRSGQGAELLGLIRGKVDAIFLKGVDAAQTADRLGLYTVIDVGLHPDPLIRSNNGTPRTLTVDQPLLERHFDVVVRLLEEVWRAEAWAHRHPGETRRFLARETNSSEYWVSVAYGEDAHLRLRTGFDKQAVGALQDFSDFLYRQHFIPELVDVASWVDARPWKTAIHPDSGRGV